MNCADVRISSSADPAPTVAPLSTTTAPQVTTTEQSTWTTSTGLPAAPSTTSSVTTTVSLPAGVSCKGNPARWTTDDQCAQCATGYKWWPCNEPDLCFCSGALSQLRADKR